VAPTFQADGFQKPDRIALVENGQLCGHLVSPRSAQEFGVAPNGAGGNEAPASLDMAPGGLAADRVIETVGDGVWVGNLWYLNFSDRSACRVTGMTRFATFWVEGGEIVAPVKVMRFDETFYSALGENLVQLTDEQDFQISTSTYYRRSTESARMPGAVVDDFALTL
jgi:predicted Zn-dependent protease